jgi:hypothetical protein
VLEHLPLADAIATATARRLFPLVEPDLIKGTTLNANGMGLQFSRLNFGKRWMVEPIGGGFRPLRGALTTSGAPLCAPGTATGAAATGRLV